MISLTTRQRDLLRLLLAETDPIGAAELAARAQLTARQVSYDLKSVRSWLAARDVTLKVTPGVGVTLDCTPERCSQLAGDLRAEHQFQLVLSPGQRQQLLAFSLLVAEEPYILYQFEQLAQVSRTTILKDLDVIDPWLTTWALELERRPNFGVQVTGRELQRRMALSALLWGDTPFDESLTRMTHGQGLVFSLADDAELLPLAQHVQNHLGAWEVRRALTQVAFAEAQVKGRFSDDAVLFLALVFTIQQVRVAEQQYVTVEAARQEWLQTKDVWSVAVQLTRRLGWGRNLRWRDDEIALIAMHLLAAPRSDRWPGDLEVDHVAGSIVDRLLAGIAGALDSPGLLRDQTLRDGIVNHVLPAYLRQRFGLWMPPPFAQEPQVRDYAREIAVASDLWTTIEAQLDVKLPQSEIANLAMLLRAATIRDRPVQSQRIIIVCPSGMATAQLLVARLKARFPHLGQPNVWSIRELSAAAFSSDALIVTTVALPPELTGEAHVIQVHPLLLPEDVEQITQWLA